MLSLGPDEMAKYPFLADAGEYLRDHGFTLEQFGTDPDLMFLVGKALGRIQTAADGMVYKSDIVGDRASKEAALPREVFSFLLAIVLLKLCGAYTLINRFSLAESRRAETYLEKDLGDIADEEKKQLAIRIIDDLFGIRVEKLGDSFAIAVSDYLTHSVHFHEREWKLVNRRVENGKVFLTPHETVRLIRKEMGVYITSKIVGGRQPPMVPGFEDAVGRLVTMSKKFEAPIVTTGEYPPCIKHAINVLEKGENLPHSGRFMLATFLLSKGQSVEQIAPLFKNAPDYNERITMYQLNHLSGGSPNATKYFCPSCTKLRTQDLCFATAECEGLISPIHFGRRSR